MKTNSDPLTASRLLTVNLRFLEDIPARKSSSNPSSTIGDTPCFSRSIRPELTSDTTTSWPNFAKHTAVVRPT